MNSRFVFASTMSCLLSCFLFCFHCLSERTWCVWGGEVSQETWPVGFVCMNWHMPHRAWSSEARASVCARVLFCLRAVVSILQEASVVKSRLFPCLSAWSSNPRRPARFSEDCQLFSWHLFPGQSKLRPGSLTHPLVRHMDKITSHFTGTDPSIPSALQNVP